MYRYTEEFLDAVRGFITRRGGNDDEGAAGAAGAAAAGAAEAAAVEAAAVGKVGRTRLSNNHRNGEARWASSVMRG